MPPGDPLLSLHNWANNRQLKEVWNQWNPLQTQGSSLKYQWLLMSCHLAFFYICQLPQLYKCYHLSLKETDTWTFFYTTATTELSFCNSGPCKPMFSECLDQQHRANIVVRKFYKAFQKMWAKNQFQLSLGSCGAVRFQVKHSEILRIDETFNKLTHRNFCVCWPDKAAAEPWIVTTTTQRLWMNHCMIFTFGDSLHLS